MFSAEFLGDDSFRASAAKPFFCFDATPVMSRSDKGERAGIGESSVVCAVIGASKSGKTSFVKFLASLAHSKNVCAVTTQYERMRRTTIRPFPYAIWTRLGMVTLIDTPGTPDFSKEIELILKRCGRVVLCVDLLDSTETLDPSVLRDVRAVTLVVTKVDLLIGLFDPSRIDSMVRKVVERIGRLSVRCDRIFVSSAKDKFVCCVESVKNGRCGFSVLKFLLEPLCKIYGRSSKKARCRLMRKFVTREDAFLGAMLERSDASASLADRQDGHGESRVFVFQRYTINGRAHAMAFVEGGLVTGSRLDSRGGKVAVKSIVIYSGEFETMEEAGSGSVCFVLFEPDVEMLAVLTTRKEAWTGAEVERWKMSRSDFPLYLRLDLNEQSRRRALDLTSFNVSCFLSDDVLFGTGEEALNNFIFEMKRVGIRAELEGGVKSGFLLCSELDDAATTNQSAWRTSASRGSPNIAMPVVEVKLFVRPESMDFALRVAADRSIVLVEARKLDGTEMEILIGRALARDVIGLSDTFAVFSIGSAFCWWRLIGFFREGSSAIPDGLAARAHEIMTTDTS